MHACSKQGFSLSAYLTALEDKVHVGYQPLPHIGLRRVAYIRNVMRMCLEKAKLGPVEGRD